MSNTSILALLNDSLDDTPGDQTTHNECQQSTLKKADMY